LGLLGSFALTAEAGPLLPETDAFVKSLKGGRFPLTLGGPNPALFAAALLAASFGSRFCRVSGRYDEVV
jgi:hypothetical protein